MAKPADWEARLEHDKRLLTNDELIRILMDNVLLAINVYASMLSVQKIHNHIGKNLLHCHTVCEAKTTHSSLLGQLVKLLQMIILIEL